MSKETAPKEHHQLRDVLRERDEVFARCEKAEKGRNRAEALCERLERSNRALTNSFDLRFVTGMELLKAEDDRDEAREWANCRTRTANKRLAEKVRAGQLHRQKCAIVWKIVDNRVEQLDLLRSQLATVRNDALDEAAARIRIMLPSGGGFMEVCNLAASKIEGLKAE